MSFLLSSWDIHARHSLAVLWRPITLSALLSYRMLSTHSAVCFLLHVFLIFSRAASSFCCICLLFRCMFTASLDSVHISLNVLPLWKCKCPWGRHYICLMVTCRQAQSVKTTHPGCYMTVLKLGMKQPETKCNRNVLAHGALDQAAETKLLM